MNLYIIIEQRVCFQLVGSHSHIFIYTIIIFANMRFLFVLKIHVAEDYFQSY